MHIAKKKGDSPLLGKISELLGALRRFSVSQMVIPCENVACLAQIFCKLGITPYVIYHSVGKLNNTLYLAVFRSIKLGVYGVNSIT
jgi:hypothetical protein